jgi:hypothetical protein
MYTMRIPGTIVLLFSVLLLLHFCEEPTTPDSVSPSINIMNPVDGATIAGPVTINAIAFDNRAVIKVEFHINGELDTTLTAEPWQYVWATESVADDSQHTIIATAWDEAGNTTVSRPVTVTVVALPGPDLLELLQALPGVTVDETTPPSGFGRAFDIFVTQPVDHSDPGGQQFQQYMFLAHRDTAAPMVFAPSGYYARRRHQQDLTGILEANEISVTHRYFPGALPVPTDWQYCTIEQSAADHHRIVELFKSIYSGVWVSSGSSKGGKTVVFHRRFYPDDVAATVAIVTPFPVEAADSRYSPFMTDVIGTAECREKIRVFQRTVLRNKAGLLPLLESHITDSGLTFPFDSAEEVLEMAVLEYPVEFWAFGSGDCSAIPDSIASVDAIFAELMVTDGFNWMAWEDLGLYSTAFYQFYTQLGYYSYVTEHLEDLLTALEDWSFRRYAPAGVPLNYDNSTMLDVINWALTEGDNIIYIYGEWDPHTAVAIGDVSATNALKIIQPDANHFVTLPSLNELPLVISTLEEWLGIDISLGKALPSLDPSGRDDFLRLP